MIPDLSHKPFFTDHRLKNIGDPYFKNTLRFGEQSIDVYFVSDDRGEDEEWVWIVSENPTILLYEDDVYETRGRLDRWVREFNISRRRAQKLKDSGDPLGSETIREVEVLLGYPEIGEYTFESKL